jgi:hypothetical protein
MNKIPVYNKLHVAVNEVNESTHQYKPYNYGSDDDRPDQPLISSRVRAIGDHEHINLYYARFNFPFRIDPPHVGMDSPNGIRLLNPSIGALATHIYATNDVVLDS